MVADPWTQWDHIATNDDDDALGDGADDDDDRPLSGTPRSLERRLARLAEARISELRRRRQVYRCSDPAIVW